MCSRVVIKPVISVTSVLKELRNLYFCLKPGNIFGIKISKPEDVLSSGRKTFDSCKNAETIGKKNFFLSKCFYHNSRFFRLGFLDTEKFADPPGSVLANLWGSADTTFEATSLYITV